MVNVLVDTEHVSILSRRRPKPRPVSKPRPRIVAVTQYWRVTDEGALRGVLVRNPDGTLTRWYLADSHPALVRFLARAAAVSA